MTSLVFVNLVTTVDCEDASRAVLECKTQHLGEDGPVDSGKV